MRLESKEFLEYYEAAHQNSANRYIHHLAHSLAAVAIVLLIFRPIIAILLIPLAFLLSWMGHYLFEKNTPAFFETDQLGGTKESAIHHIKVAVGGILWSFVCFLRLFGQGPLAK